MEALAKQEEKLFKKASAKFREENQDQVFAIFLYLPPFRNLNEIIIKTLACIIGSHLHAVFARESNDSEGYN